MPTIVGEGSLIKGQLEGDEDLTVFGRIEGVMRLSRTLMIEPSGIVKAEVTVRNAVINGVVVGNITASDSIELTEQARVVGDLTAPRVIIVDGASFRGQVDMGDLDIKRPASSPRPSAASRPSVAATVPSRPVSAPPTRAPLKTPVKTLVKAAVKKKAPAAPPKPPRRGKGKQVRVKKKRR